MDQNNEAQILRPTRSAAHRAVRGALNLATRLLARRPRPRPVDVLLVEPGGPGGAARLAPLLDLLTARGLTVGVHHLTGVAGRVRRWQFARPAAPVPERQFRHQAAHAAWIARRYRPRLVIGSLEICLVAPYLRRELAAIGGKTVNVPHCPTDPELYDVFDFDYYLTFGPKASDSCRAARVRYGDTRILAVGSPFIPPDYRLPARRVGDRALLFSQSSWANPPALEAEHRRSYAVVADWARAHPGVRLTVKRHPYDPDGVLEEIFAGSPVELLPRNTPLREALADVGIVLTVSSAASVEAALLRRPIVVVNAGDPDPHLELERFFGPAATTPDALQARLDAVCADFDAALEAGEAFVARHLAHTDARERIAEVLVAILEGRADAYDWEPLPGTHALRERP